MCGYYILASKRNGTLYTGVTWGIPRRLAIFTVYEARRGTAPSPSSSLCSSQGSSSAASAAREAFFQPKDLVWLDSCDKHRNEEIKQDAAGSAILNRPQEGIGGLQSLLPIILATSTGMRKSQAAAGIPNLGRPQPPTCSTLSSIRSISSSDRPKWWPISWISTWVMISPSVSSFSAQ
jgi:hypothetical protein